MHRLISVSCLLYFPQPLDFEEVQNLELALLIRNVAPFIEGDAVATDVGVKVGEGDPLALAAGAGGGASAEVGLNIGGHAGVEGPGVDLSAGLHPEANIDVDTDAGRVKPESEPNGKGYSIMIAVNNVPEDPAFVPQFREVPVSEDPNDQPEDGILAVVAAIDPDTGKPAGNVRLVNLPTLVIVVLSAQMCRNGKCYRQSRFHSSGVQNCCDSSDTDPCRFAGNVIWRCLKCFKNWERQSQNWEHLFRASKQPFSKQRP